jgi:hypothetical protein
MKIKKQTLQWTIAGTAAICLLIAGCKWYSYLHSPERVVHLAIAALNRHDSEALVGLASEKERHALNLTPQTVQACLRETYWRDSTIKSGVVVKGERTKYADLMAYWVEVEGFSNQSKHCELEVYQGSEGGWHLGLSELLFCMPKMCNGLTGDYAPIWDAIATRAGIKGVTIPSGETRYTDGTSAPRISLTHGNPVSE